jgi:hypothetical protein
MRDFSWFLSFWGWAEEGCRVRAHFFSPFADCGRLWGMWWRMPEVDRRWAGEIGGNVVAQRQFTRWLQRDWRRNYMPRHVFGARLLLHQLALVEPFNNWKAMEPFQDGYKGVGRWC